MQWQQLGSEFHTGACFDAYRALGAHPAEDAGQAGWAFRLWAPGAQQVYLIGDFSGWQGLAMARDAAGVWSVFVPGAVEGQLYKYSILGRDGVWAEHADPYAFAAELRPGSASRLADLAALGSIWTDADWMRCRDKCYNSPMSIYELHAGSWRTHEDGSWFRYDELAEALPPWLASHGFTHIELLPLAEHPFDGSWGYQTTGYFAVTSRYGGPAGFARLVNACHAAGIGVLMDFVPVHFAQNQDALARLDGGPLYEYDSDIGQSEWGSCNFNFYRGEVRSFLQSAAALWLDVYHCDGLRMDAISRALYWQGDERRGVNPGAVQFLQRMNEGLHRRWPTAILAAEDSTNFLKVTAPVAYDGLGFDYKWDMGWMHDTLDYFATPFGERPAHYHKLTFSMAYFYQELYLLALSHDEVVHGKKTVIDKLWGTYEEKCAGARLLYFYMFTHPGKKLNFMGNELAQFREWDEAREQDWPLLRYPFHDAFQRYFGVLGQLYRSEPALYRDEYHPERFCWLVADDPLGGVYAWLRCDANGGRLLAVMNTQDHPYPSYGIPMDRPCRAQLLLNTAWSCWGGPTPGPADGSLYGGPGGAVYTTDPNGRLCLPLAPISGMLLRLSEA